MSLLYLLLGESKMWDYWLKFDTNLHSIYNEYSLRLLFFMPFK